MPVLGKVGLVNKGTYNASTAYTALDFVKYNGSTYVALKGVQGITPSNDGTNWSYLAQGVDVTISNSQTVTTPGTALDAVQANKNVNGSLAYNIDQQITSINDSLAAKANKSAPTLYFKIGNQDGDPQSSYPHVELRSSGNSTNGRALSVQYCTASNASTGHCLMDKNGNFLPDHPTKTDLTDIVTVGTASATVSVTPGEAVPNATLSFTTPSGYTPIGVVGWSVGGTGSTNTTIYAAFINSARTAVAYKYRNTGTSSSAVSQTHEFRILFIKSDFFSA